MKYLDLISSSIKKFRKEQNFTQEEFAEIINMSVQGLRNLEQAKYQPTPATIDKICKALKITPFDLLLPEITSDMSVKIGDIVKKLKLCNEKQLEIVNDFIDLIRKKCK